MHFPFTSQFSTDAAKVADAQRVAGRLSMLRELDVRGYANDEGFASTQAWLARELLVDGSVAAADVRAAFELDPVGDVPPPPGAVLPRPRTGQVCLAATGRALLVGQVSRAHAEAISSCIRALPIPAGATLAERDDLHTQAQTALLVECSRLTPAQVRRCGARIQHLVDPDGVLADERAAVTRARLWITYDPDTSSYRFGGTTDVVTGAQLATLIDAHAKPRPVLIPEPVARVRHLGHRDDPGLSG